MTHVHYTQQSWRENQVGPQAMFNNNNSNNNIINNNFIEHLLYANTPVNTLYALSHLIL